MLFVLGLVYGALTGAVIAGIIIRQGDAIGALGGALAFGAFVLLLRAGDAG